MKGRKTGKTVNKKRTQKSDELFQLTFSSRFFAYRGKVLDQHIPVLEPHGRKGQEHCHGRRQALGHESDEDSWNAPRKQRRGSSAHETETM